MTRRWLVLRLDAPLMAFGGIAIDQVGPTRDFPAVSMMTGVIGNALGWHWSDRALHQALQDRLVFAARHDRDGTRLTDSQNVQLASNDKGWTTMGMPEGRSGATYDAPHRRLRDYLADASVCVVLRLEPVDKPPFLDEVAEAIEQPVRPLFLGRKPCVPSSPLVPQGDTRWITADTAWTALRSVPGNGRQIRAQWPLGEGPGIGEGADRIIDLADLRNWRTGLHAGMRQVAEGWIVPDATT